MCFVLCLAVIAAYAGEEDFYNALQNCSKYSSNGETVTDGAVVKFSTHIAGWEDDKCIYKERLNYSGIEACTTCRLTQRQINELTDVMRAYTTVQKYSVEKLDTSSMKNLEGNPVINVWNKYLKDSSVCNIELSK